MHLGKGLMCSCGLRVNAKEETERMNQQGHSVVNCVPAVHVLNFLEIYHCFLNVHASAESAQCVVKTTTVYDRFRCKRVIG